MTSSSGFSLVGSSMIGSLSANSMGSSGMLVDANVKRGWDWRKGLPSKVSGEDILRILRLRLSKEVAMAWLE
jgi:hypothetical protein